MCLIFSLAFSGSSKTAGWNGDDSPDALTHGLPSPGALRWRKLSFGCLHLSLPLRFSQTMRALPGLVARRGCDLAVSLSMKLKPCGAGCKEGKFFYQTTAKFPPATNRRPGRWECCSRHFLTKPLCVSWGAPAAALPDTYLRRWEVCSL